MCVRNCFLAASGCVYWQPADHLEITSNLYMYNTFAELSKWCIDTQRLGPKNPEVEDVLYFTDWNMVQSIGPLRWHNIDRDLQPTFRLVQPWQARFRFYATSCPSLSIHLIFSPFCLSYLLLHVRCVFYLRWLKAFIPPCRFQTRTSLGSL